MNIKRLFAQLLATAAVLLGFATPAHAVDGCKVLLCFAGNWRDISQCRPEVEQALKDQAKGKGWPTCNTTQPNGTQQTENSIVSRVIYGPSCPFYFRQWQFVPDPSYNTLENGTSWDGKIYGKWQMTCQSTEILATTINGQPWKASYLLPDGSTFDQWMPAALAAMPDLTADANSLEVVQAAWAAAGSPTTKPSLPGPEYVDLSSGAYYSCYPYGGVDDPNLCHWFDDGVFVPW